ncbi:MAG: VOC family protein [Oscillospiraceae bacterium]|jgi:catechol 2,3-dioxygenase-like lactoylglutathione lyase family enzyme|nr:VOC family protein [Oscillospiraceae bacterium]
MIKYSGTLIAVDDMERSKMFYRELFGLEVEEDNGANVMLSGGIYLQTYDTWNEFAEFGGNITRPNNSSELYFATDDMDGFLDKLERCENIRYVHHVKKHSWGQRAVRFYDPDGHIIEVGESSF